MNMLTYTKVNNISIYLYAFEFLLIIYSCVGCWQDDPKDRPDIRYVGKSLLGMISGTSIINVTDNDRQQINEDNNSFTHFN